MLDEHGLPIPRCGKVELFTAASGYDLVAADDDVPQTVVATTRREDAEFFASAWNWIDECRKVVYLAKKWYDTHARDWDSTELKELGETASNLWYDMLADAKVQAEIPEYEWIKPCPFCGGVATLSWGNESLGTVVGCDACDVELHEVGNRRQDRENAIRRWNKRK